MKENLKVGDKLYIVYRDKRQGEPKYVEITKIARKYLYVKMSEWGNYEEKVLVENLTHYNNGYSPNYACYLSEDDYLREQYKREVFFAFNNKNFANKLPSELLIELYEKYK